MSRHEITAPPAWIKSIRAMICLLIVTAWAQAQADETPQHLPVRQAWTNPALIIQSNDWANVPGFVGYRGDDLAPKPGLPPNTITADGARSPVYVRPNQDDPKLLRSGGLAEFDGLPNPTIALKGSATASAPSLVLHLNTSGKQHIVVSYNLRDIDDSISDAVQPVALQYRIQSKSPYAEVPLAYVADATTGPDQATLVTPITVELPAAADNQPHLQIRWITANAESYDEWVGIDDIVVVGVELTNAAPTQPETADWSIPTGRPVQVPQPAAPQP